MENTTFKQEELVLKNFLSTKHETKLFTDNTNPTMIRDFKPALKVTVMRVLYTLSREQLNYLLDKLLEKKCINQYDMQQILIHGLINYVQQRKNHKLYQDIYDNCGMIEKIQTQSKKSLRNSPFFDLFQVKNDNFLLIASYLNIKELLRLSSCCYFLHYHLLKQSLIQTGSFVDFMKYSIRLQYPPTNFYFHKITDLSLAGDLHHFKYDKHYI